MFLKNQHLARINHVFVNKLSKDKKIKSNFLAKEISSPIKNFYMTDSVIEVLQLCQNVL